MISTKTKETVPMPYQPTPEEAMHIQANFMEILPVVQNEANIRKIAMLIAYWAAKGCITDTPKLCLSLRGVGDIITDIANDGGPESLSENYEKFMPCIEKLLSQPEPPTQPETVAPLDWEY